MSRNFLTSVNLNGNAIAGATVENLTADPSGAALGRIYFKPNASSGATYGSLFVKDLSSSFGQVLSSNLSTDFVIPSSTNTITVAKVPTNANDVTNKAYVDGIASGVNAHDAVGWASTTNVSGTYATASAGVGDTISGSGTLAIDSHNIVAGDAGTNVQNGTGLRVLLKDQTNTDQNGIYVVTACVSTVSWTLTRAYDYDTIGEVSAGDIVYVLNGTTNGKYTYVETSKPAAITGNNTSANAITFSIFSNGNLSSIVGITQGGTGSNITTATSNTFLVGNGTVFVARALASTDRSALGAASSGSNSDITQLTGLTTALTAGQGGTGLSSYTIGDLIYASGTTTLASLADVATGNALLSGGIGSAPAYGKVGLTTHITGILPIANGGTGSNITTATNGQFLVGNGTVFAPRTLAFTDLVATSSSATSNTTSAVVTAQYSITQKLSVTFTANNVSTGFTVTHNLGRFVIVQVTDLNGLQVECDVTNTATTTQVSFATAPIAPAVFYCTIIG